MALPEEWSYDAAERRRLLPRFIILKTMAEGDGFSKN